MKAAFLKHLGFFWTAGGAEGASVGWKEGVESRAVMQHVVCLLNWIWVSTACLETALAWTQAPMAGEILFYHEAEGPKWFCCYVRFWY